MILKQKGLFRTPWGDIYDEVEYDSSMGVPPGFTIQKINSDGKSESIHFKYVGAQEGELIYQQTDHPEEN